MRRMVFAFLTSLAAAVVCNTELRADDNPVIDKLGKKIDGVVLTDLGGKPAPLLLVQAAEQEVQLAVERAVGVAVAGRDTSERANATSFAVWNRFSRSFSRSRYAGCGA